MSNGKSRWKRAVESGAVEARQFDDQVARTSYSATVRVTIMAENKREAKRALESVGSLAFASQVRVDVIDGPDEIDLPDN